MYRLWMSIISGPSRSTAHNPIPRSLKALSTYKKPRPVDSISMVNGSHFVKDVGEFRVIYRFDDTTLYVTVVRNRNDSAA